MTDWRTDPETQQARNYLDLMLDVLVSACENRDLGPFRDFVGDRWEREADLTRVPDDVAKDTKQRLTTAWLHAKSGEWERAKGQLEALGRVARGDE